MTRAIKVPEIPETIPALKRYISAWIYHAVSRRAGVMRRVLKRPFGSVHKWVTRVKAGEYCGCLIGSTALELNQRSASRNFGYGCYRLVSKNINDTYNAAYTENVGLAVSDLAARIGEKWLGGLNVNSSPTPRTERWLKSVIRRALNARDAKRARP